MKRVLVLGATGTLGLPICRRLKENGYEVFAVGHSSRSHKLFSDLGMDFANMDIANKDDFKALPQSRVDCVINFAGCLPAMMTEESDNSLYPDTILKGSIHVLDYMRKVGCRKLIFPQSVYDLHHLFGTPTPISADAPRENPLTGDHAIYVICKNAALDVMEYYHNEYGLNTITLRLPGVYQYHPKPYILINGKMRVKSERILINKAKKGEPLEIWGDPKRVLESVCVEDFLQIVQKSIESENAHGIYNVGNGGSTLEERVLGIRDVFCPKDHISEIVYCPDKKNCTQYVLDIEKTKKELGYVPQYSWHDYCVNLKHHMETNPNAEIWGKFEDYYHLL